MRSSVMTSIALLSATLLSGCDRGSPEANAANAANVAEAPEPAKPAALPVDAQGFVTVLATGDLYELESSRMALQRQTSPGVNEMAQMLQREHTQSSAKLKAAAAQAGLEVPATLDAEKQKLIDDLKAAQGADFDQTFLNQQRLQHAKTLMMIQNYQAVGDNPALKDLAAALQKKIEFHIDRLNATLK
jgi:putative membrane protein